MSFFKTKTIEQLNAKTLDDAQKLLQEHKQAAMYHEHMAQYFQAVINQISQTKKAPQQ